MDTASTMRPCSTMKMTEACNVIMPLSVISGGGGGGGGGSGGSDGGGSGPPLPRETALKAAVALGTGSLSGSGAVQLRGTPWKYACCTTVCTWDEGSSSTAVVRAIPHAFSLAVDWRTTCSIISPSSRLRQAS